MPDAHVGYGLPIGGVLACDNAVIPYAVGVDIACRMKLSVLDMPPATLDSKFNAYKEALEGGTRFGVGVEYKQPKSHAVLDQDWTVTRITREYKDRALAAAGYVRIGQPLRRVRRADARRSGRGTRTGRRAVRGTAEPQRQSWRGRRRLFDLQRDCPRQVAPEVRRIGSTCLVEPGHSGRSGVLGGHELDGRLCGGES